MTYLPHRLDLHRAINRYRVGFSGERAGRGERGTWEVGLGHPIKVTCSEPPAPFVSTARQCRIEGPRWHNRVHIARDRWVAAAGERTLEYGVALCGAHLVDPTYIDEPHRDCGCGGSASVCPRCHLLAKAMVN